MLNIYLKKNNILYKKEGHDKSLFLCYNIDMEDEIKRKEKWRNSMEKYRDKYYIDKTIKNNNKSFKENQYDFIILSF